MQLSGLFGRRSINEESASEHLQSTLERCFKTVDVDECGFISSQKLKQVTKLRKAHDKMRVFELFE